MMLQAVSPIQDKTTQLTTSRNFLLNGLPQISCSKAALFDREKIVNSHVIV